MSKYKFASKPVNKSLLVRCISSALQILVTFIVNFKTSAIQVLLSYKIAKLLEFYKISLLTTLNKTKLNLIASAFCRISYLLAKLQQTAVIATSIKVFAPSSKAASL